MKTFNDIIGHEEIINHIQSAIKLKKVSHAYIFDGEQGIGKKLLVSIFAKTLQCEAQGVQPCNQCDSCIKFDSNNHPDIIYVKSTKKNSIGVSDIREQINEDIHIKPYKYPYKMYIINDADLMTEQAQNALLKTIEEPPSYGVIILIAKNSHSFLPTIQSRCVHLNLKPIAENKIFDYLKTQLKVQPEQASIYASFSRGNIGKGKDLVLSSDFNKMREDVITLVENIVSNNEYLLFESVKIFDEYKDKLDILFELLLTWFHDLLILEDNMYKKYLIHQDKYKTLLKQRGKLSYNKICTFIENIEKRKKDFTVNVNYQLSIEMMLLNL